MLNLGDLLFQSIDATHVRLYDRNNNTSNIKIYNYHNEIVKSFNKITQGDEVKTNDQKLY